jgi:hypothetical protein
MYGAILDGVYHSQTELIKRTFASLVDTGYVSPPFHRHSHSSSYMESLARPPRRTTPSTATPGPSASSSSTSSPP